MKMMGNASAVNRQRTCPIPSSITENLLPSVGSHSVEKCRLAGLFKTARPIREVANVTSEATSDQVLALLGSRMEKTARPLIKGININRTGVICFKGPTI